MKTAILFLSFTISLVSMSCAMEASMNEPHPWGWIMTTYSGNKVIMHREWSKSERLYYEGSIQDLMVKQSDLNDFIEALDIEDLSAIKRLSKPRGNTSITSNMVKGIIMTQLIHITLLKNE